MEDLDIALQYEQRTELDMLRSWWVDDNQDRTATLLKMISTAPPHSFDTVLLNDHMFIQSFGDVPAKWPSAMRESLSTEGYARNVGFVLASGLRWLATKPARLSLLIYAQRLQRLLGTMAGMDMDKFIKRSSRGLPTQRDTLEILSCVEAFAELMLKYNNDPNSVGKDELIKHYRKFGVRLKWVGKGIESWTVVVKKATAAAICASLFGNAVMTISKFSIFFRWFKYYRKLLSYAGGLAGIIYGTEWLTIGGRKTLKFNGWKTADSVVEAAERLMDTITNLQDLSNNISRTSIELMLKAGDDDAKQDARDVARAMQRTEIVCRRLVRRLTYAFTSIEKKSDYLEKQK